MLSICNPSILPQIEPGGMPVSILERFLNRSTRYNPNSSSIMYTTLLEFSQIEFWRPTPYHCFDDKIQRYLIMQFAENGEHDCDKLAYNERFGATRGKGTMAINLHAFNVLGVRVKKRKGV